MSANDVLIRAQELSGQWTAIGSGLARGIVVEDLTMDADLWGPRSAQFVLKRNPQAIFPDISSFTPIEIEVGGIVCFEGRVKETPSRDGSDRQMSVSCEGWQYHLDDDPYQKTYVQTDLASWNDQRSYLDSQLANFIQGGQVTTDGTGVVFALPGETTAGTVYPANACVGVTLDFGTTLCKRVGAINWQSSNNAAIAVNCIGTDTPNTLSGFGETAFTFLNNSATSGSNGATFVTARRYVHFYMIFAAGGTLTQDVWIRFGLARLFAATAYDSGGGSSILKASDVVTDAKSKATLLLSSDATKIQSTTFNIPDFTMSGPATPREAISAVNAYQAWQPRITRNKVLEYRPLPSTAIYEAPETGGIEFEDASANSGLDIYSGVNVTYTGPDGIAASVPRAQPSSLYTPSLIVFTNPGFEVNVLNWTSLGSGTVTTARDTVQHDTGVASMKITYASAGAIGITTSSFTGGSPTPGNTYRLQFAFRTDTALTSGIAYIKDSNAQLLASLAIGSPALNTWTTYTLDFIPVTSGSPTVGFSDLTMAGAGNSWIDSFVLYESAPTLVNRRGFRRTKILDTNMSLSPAAAQQIGDVYLTGHKTTPFKGTITINGSSAVRLAQGGVQVPPWHLLYNTGELIRLPHLIDPDSGGIGREGRIATVTCNPIAGTASVELDNTRTNLDALLARLSVVTGQITSA